MPVLSLDMDRKFLEFNFCEVWDPTLKPGLGPRQADLIEMVYHARQGDRSAAFEFCSTMYWTLREAAFTCFEKIHGPRPIHYHEWFYCKLQQLLEILVYEELSVDGYAADGSLRHPQTDQPWKEGFIVLGTAGPPVQPDDLEAAFRPEDNSDAACWAQIVYEVCEAPGDRLTVLESGLAGRRQQRVLAGNAEAAGLPSNAPLRRREWNANRDRNRVIRNLQAQGKDGGEICQGLDERTIPSLPILQRHNIHRWVDGWNNLRFQRNIQQLFSKLRRPQKVVKC
jgi:hypothetical protein